MEKLFWWPANDTGYLYALNEYGACTQEFKYRVIELISEGYTEISWRTAEALGLST